MNPRLKDSFKVNEWLVQEIKKWGQKFFTSGDTDSQSFNKMPTFFQPYKIIYNPRPQFMQKCKKYEKKISI